MQNKIKMKVANNRSTKEMVGYWIGSKGSIVVTAYDMEKLQKKFDKKLEKLSEDQIKEATLKEWKLI